METKKLKIFKIFITILFTAAVAGAFVYVVWKGDLQHNILAFSCIAASFVFSLIFIKKIAKKILITIALALNVVADYFLVLMPGQVANSTLIGLCIFCGVQFVYLLYSLYLTKGVGFKIVNIAFRVVLCLTAYFIVPKYIKLDATQLIALMFILNGFVTLLTLLFKLKTNWLLFIGFLLFFASGIFVGLTNGAAEMLNLSGEFVDFIYTYDLAFYCYIPGVFLIAASSVWEN